MTLSARMRAGYWEAIQRVGLYRGMPVANYSTALLKETLPPVESGDTYPRSRSLTSRESSSSGVFSSQSSR